MLEASQQPLLYSSAESTTIEPLDTKALLPMMIFMDPPEHDVQRKLVSRAFTPRAISELEPFVRETAIDCLEPLAAQRGGDFVEEFSAVLPMNVIMELLGVPAADRNTLRHWMDATLDRLEAPPYIPDHAIEAMGHAGEYWDALVKEKRAHPDEGFISKLCEAEIVDDDGAAERLTDREVIGFASLIGSAGTETLTKLLGFGYGLHFCLGAALARLEGRIGLEEFAARFPRYEIDESKARRVHMSNVHGYASVPFAAVS